MSRRPPQHSFSTFIEPHLQALHRTAWRLCRHRDDAEDLVQDVCLRAHTALNAGERVEAPRAWLLRIQYRLHVDHVRRERHRRSELYDDERLPAGEPAATSAPETAASTAAAVDALNRAWPALNTEQQALLAHYAEGYSLAEIAAISGIGVNALKARLHRARTRLGRLIEQDARPAADATSGDIR